MKTFLLSILLILFVFAGFSQDAAAPHYLVNQRFPDSVQQVLLTAINGEKIPFSEMLNAQKGKKVVIDFWASWCKDCVGGLPKVKELQKRAEPENIVYVFLSFDKTEDKWKSAIDRLDIQGEHYLIGAGWNNPLSYYIGLDWIPRYMVLNEKGMVILPKAIVADDEDLIRALLPSIDL